MWENRVYSQRPNHIFRLCNLLYDADGIYHYVGIRKNDGISNSFEIQRIHEFDRVLTAKNVESFDRFKFPAKSKFYVVPTGELLDKFMPQHSAATQYKQFHFDRTAVISL